MQVRLRLDPKLSDAQLTGTEAMHEFASSCKGKSLIIKI